MYMCERTCDNLQLDVLREFIFLSGVKYFRASFFFFNSSWHAPLEDFIIPVFFFIIIIILNLHSF